MICTNWTFLSVLDISDRFLSPFCIMMMHNRNFSEIVEVRNGSEWLEMDSKQTASKQLHVAETSFGEIYPDDTIAGCFHRFCNSPMTFQCHQVSTRSRRHQTNTHQANTAAVSSLPTSILYLQHPHIEIGSDLAIWCIESWLHLHILACSI